MPTLQQRAYEEMGLARTIPADDRGGAPRGSTLEMPSRPAPPSPRARSVYAPPRVVVSGGGVIFPREKLSRLDDFVRLRLASESATFLATLAREGITPEYYATMILRFDAARRADPALEAAFVERLARARRGA